MKCDSQGRITLGEEVNVKFAPEDKLVFVKVCTNVFKLCKYEEVVNSGYMLRTNCKIDSKYRIALPKVLRDDYGEKYDISIDKDSNVIFEAVK